LRFLNVTIPNGATIVSAKVQFYCLTGSSGNNVNVKLHMENADNPAAPTSSSDLAGRSLTTGVNWNTVGAWTNTNWYDSVDISSELQTVVDRVGWASGQAMIVHVRDNGSTANTTRNAASRNYSASYGAKLVVGYVE